MLNDFRYFRVRLIDEEEVVAMAPNRRFFLKALGAGVAVISLPEITSHLSWLSFSSLPDRDLKALIHELLIGQRSGGPFVAHADTQLIAGNPQRLLSAPLGLLTMLNWLGMNTSFSSQINYDEAAQCKPHFERQEEIWRQNDFTSFTDIKRAEADSDVAIAVGGIINSNRDLTQAMGATQHRNDAAVPLAGHDPTVALATRWLLDKNLAGKEIAQSLALTDKRDVAIDGGTSVTRYETPVTASVYIPRVRLNTPVPNAVGIIAANTKKEPNLIYVADVHA